MSSLERKEKEMAFAWVGRAWAISILAQGGERSGYRVVRMEGRYREGRDDRFEGVQGSEVGMGLYCLRGWKARSSKKLRQLSENHVSIGGFRRNPA